MSRVRPFLLAALCAALLWPGAPALADATGTLMFSRDTLTIVRKNPPPPLPWAGKKAPPVDPAVTFDVVVRNGAALYRQEGWYNVSNQSEDSGLLLLFSDPVVTPITRASQYVPFDILMIDREGNIVQIAPGIVPASLEQDIFPPSPVLAFLFLKGGTCAKMSIGPGDTVQYAAFRRPPAMLMAPAPAPTPAPATKPAEPAAPAATPDAAPEPAAAVTH